jgi:hypothetical protein
MRRERLEELGGPADLGRSWIPWAHSMRLARPPGSVLQDTSTDLPSATVAWPERLCYRRDNLLRSDWVNGRHDSRD